MAENVSGEVQAPTEAGELEWVGVHRLTGTWTAIRLNLKPAGHGVLATIELPDLAVAETSPEPVQFQSCRIRVDVAPEALRLEGKFTDGTISGLVWQGEREAPCHLVQVSGNPALNRHIGVYTLEGQIVLLGQYEGHLTFLKPGAGQRGELYPDGPATFRSREGYSVSFSNGTRPLWREPGSEPARELHRW